MLLREAGLAEVIPSAVNAAIYREPSAMFALHVCCCLFGGDPSRVSNFRFAIGIDVRALAEQPEDVPIGDISKKPSEWSLIPHREQEITHHASPSEFVA